MTAEAVRSLAEMLGKLADEVGAKEERAAKPAPQKIGPDWVRLTTLAAELGVCERTVRRWQLAGDLQTHKIGGCIFADRNELSRMFARESARAKPSTPSEWAKRKLGKK